MDKLKVFFDLDGVICSDTKGKYHNSKPNKELIAYLNLLHDKGHEISIYTSRYMGRLNEDVFSVNEFGFEKITSQLKDWGVKYNRLILGKPRYDIFIDDKAYHYHSDQSLEELKERVSELEK